MTAKNQAIIFFLVSIVGLVLPATELIPFVIENRGFDIFFFLEEATANRATRFLSWDLFITGFTFLLFLLLEKNKPKYWWTSVLLVFGIGLSCGFPFYLGLKKLQEDRE